MLAVTSGSMLSVRMRTLLKRVGEWLYWLNARVRSGKLSNDHYVHFYTDHFGLSPAYYDGKRILDIGCGPRGSLEWADHAAERVGLDPLAAQYQHLGAAAHRMRYVASGAESIPFPDGHFDLVTCVSVLEFIGSIDARRAFIAEMLRVTQRGGHVYLATPSPLRLREYHSRRLLGDWRQRRGYPWSSSAASLRRMFDGCTVESLSTERLRRHPRLRRVGWAAPVLSWALPWQRILARKD